VFSGTVTAQAYALSGGGNIMTTASTDTVTGTKTHVAPVVHNSSLTVNGDLFGRVNASTQGFIFTNLVGSQGMGTCLISTLTLTTDNIPVRLKMSGGFVQAPNASFTSNILVDGAYLAPYTSALPMYKFLNAEGSASGQAITIDVESPVALSSGTHSFCYSQGSAAGSGVDCSQSPCVLRVEEAH
jgi:hypothetical protein